MMGQLFSLSKNLMGKEEGKNSLIIVSWSATHQIFLFNSRETPPASPYKESHHCAFLQ